MSLTENSDQVFLPGGCNRTQNLRFGPYTIKLFSSYRANTIFVLHKVQREITQKVKKAELPFLNSARYFMLIDI